YRGGVTPITLSATRFFLPTVILLIILSLKGAPIIMSKKSGQIAVILGVITIIYNFALLVAIERLPVPIAILIFFLFPILTGFSLTLTGAEAFTITKFIGAVVALIGLALVLGVSFHQLDSLGILLATIGAIGLATVSVLSHHLVKGEDPRQAMLYMAMTALAIMIVVITIRGELDLPTNTDGWIGFLVSNILYALGMITYFYAISMAGASATTFFVNLEPLVVTGAAFLILGQTLTPLQLLGVLIVVGALIFYARSGSD
ncbi:MAG TPA: DMT family transporter, partial [Rhodospirillales bacterium]|nr:DMT family transporter [Rhodospirillales bacterium]